jgi:hypothetical protein
VYKQLKFFLKKALWFLPIPIFIIGVNYFAQKTNLLQNNARDAANYLLAGYNIANAYTCGDSTIKEFYAKNITQKKDILVFGSSRSLGINSKLFPGKSFFNTSVTDGRLENFIHLYFLWRENGLIPSQVVLGLDAWLLKSKSQDDLRAIIKDKFAGANSESLLAESASFDTFCSALPRKTLPAVAKGYGGHGRMSGVSCPLVVSAHEVRVSNHAGIRFTLNCINRYNQTWEFTQRLCSIDLFRNSLLYFVNTALHKFGFKGIGVFYPTKESFAVSEVMLADGSINYGLVRRSRSAQEVERLVVSGIKEKGFFHLNDFDKLDDDMIKLFELFIKLLLHDNVSVTFFLTPYHPKAFELLKVSEKYKIICTARDYFIDLAQKNGIQVVGDFDPATNHLEGSDFFDEFHPKESAMQKIFS